MAYCGPRGIPHSHFLGGPVSWTADDRDKALAWQQVDWQTCGSCGTRPDEWDPATGGGRDAWQFDIDICPGCEQRQRTEEHARSDQWADARGVTIRARRPDRR